MYKITTATIILAVWWKGITKLIIHMPWHSCMRSCVLVNTVIRWDIERSSFFIPSPALRPWLRNDDITLGLHLRLCQLYSPCSFCHQPIHKKPSSLRAAPVYWWPKSPTKASCWTGHWVRKCGLTQSWYSPVDKAGSLRSKTALDEIQRVVVRVWRYYK